MPGKTNKLWRFPGGLELEAHKDKSTRFPIAFAGIPPKLRIPVHQNSGPPPEVIVKAGQNVARGELIARPADYLSAPVHAPTSGQVTAISELRLAHPAGKSGLCITITPDGRDLGKRSSLAVTDYLNLSPRELRDRLRRAGVVGLGGALFPLAAKLAVAQDEVEMLIINGVECEPYVSCDQSLMEHHAHELVRGIAILAHCAAAAEVVLAVEENKRQALASLEEALEGHELNRTLRIATIPPRFPSGGERQLIQILTGVAVPATASPTDLGYLCVNVATAYATHRALDVGEPLISRVVTVTGAGIRKPRNLRALIGTPVEYLIRRCGGYRETAARLVIGGPMTGFALSTDEVPVSKSTHCIWVAATDEVYTQASQACIRCGVCADVCPVKLLPQQLWWHARAQQYREAQDYHLFDCIECGCCAYVCPSHIDLVAEFRGAKQAIWQFEHQQRNARDVKARYHQRAERLAELAHQTEQQLNTKHAAATNREQAKREIDAALQRNQQTTSDDKPSTSRSS